jgi:hypothetical protein
MAEIAHDLASFDLLSPFEELVLTAVREVGPEAGEMIILCAVQKLAQRSSIPLTRVDFALRTLAMAGCLYSWTDKPELGDGAPRYYRVQLRGERGLEAAAQRRGSKPLGSDFHRAGRFGIVWDMVLGYQSRKRAEESRD